MAVVPFFRTLIVVIAVGVIVTGGIAVRRYTRGAAFVVQAAGLNGTAGRLARWEFESVTVLQPMTVPWRGGALRARAYQPVHSRGTRAILLVPGVHAAGIDEPRLVGFARDLTGMGHPVLTVELPDLTHYEITSRTTDMIEDAAGWMISRPEYAGPDGRIGMMGISFGGGLSLVAAGRPSISSRVAFAMSFGGHGDLPRTLRYLCTGIQPDGALRPPHDYGLAIVLLNVADQVVPSVQVEALRSAILSFLEASRLDMVDKTKAAAEFARAKSLEAALPEPAHTYMGYVNARDVARLGPVLLPTLAARGGRSVPLAFALERATMPGLPSARDGRQRGAGDRVDHGGRGASSSRAHRPPARDAADHPRGSRSPLHLACDLEVGRLLDGSAR